MFTLFEFALPTEVMP